MPPALSSTLHRTALGGALLLLATSPIAAEDAARPDAAPRNVILIVVDGMTEANEETASRYEYGEPGRLSFQSWPYQTYVTTWDVTCYNRYANGDAEAVDTARQWTPESFDPRLGYDPDLGGTVPALHPDPERDAYFLRHRFGQGGSGKQGVGRCATDSASAATAMATGHKTDDGRISWKSAAAAGTSLHSEYESRLQTIAEQLRAQRGGAIGVVSTVPFSHATPAAFVSHNPARGNYQSIAREILFETQPEVVIGGGWPGALDKPDKYIGAGAYELVQSGALSRLVVVEQQPGGDSAAALASVQADAILSGRRLFGLFGNADGLVHHSVADTRLEDGYAEFLPGNPSLSDMASAALSVLSRDPEGFFLLLEQGDVDWANHAGDLAWGIGAMHDADMAAQAVVDWINRDGDAVTMDNTLVLLVSDHGHYMRLAAGYSYGFRELPPGVPGKLVDIEGDEFKRKQTSGRDVVWSTPLTHSNELVTLYAIGAGLAEGDAAGGLDALFEHYEGANYPGQQGMERVIDNTDIFRVMRDWLRLTGPDDKAQAGSSAG